MNVVHSMSWLGIVMLLSDRLPIYSTQSGLQLFSLGRHRMRHLLGEIAWFSEVYMHALQPQQTQQLAQACTEPRHLDSASYEMALGNNG